LASVHFHQQLLVLRLILFRFLVLILILFRFLVLTVILILMLILVLTVILILIRTVLKEPWNWTLMLSLRQFL
jgi:hypothetical protein